MKVKIITAILMICVSAYTVDAQCRSFAKNSCETQLEGYMVSGRMYGGFVTQGQEMELNVVLNGGQKYRLVNCSKPDLGKVQVQLLDSEGNIIFDNADHDMAQNWDFDVKSTQEFKIRTIVPGATKSTSSSVRDCSILILGSKAS
jgi:hypothetical protein